MTIAEKRPSHPNFAHQEATMERALCVLLCLCSTAAAQQVGGPKPQPSEKEYRGKPQEKVGVTVTPITLPARNLVALCWADPRGEALCTADDKGVVRRLLVPSFRETHTIDLGGKCNGLVLSPGGLLACLPDAQ